MGARLVFGVAVLLLTACTGNREAAVSASPAETASVAPTEAASVSPTETASVSPTEPVSAVASESPAVLASVTPGAPSPAATPTQDPNLLSVVNGAIIRKWTVNDGVPGAALVMGSLYNIAPAYAKPVSFLYELPSTAQITRFGATGRSPVPVTIHISTGTSRSALSDAGTITMPANMPNTEATLDANVTARYVRVTIERPPGNDTYIFRVAAYGTPGAPQAGSLAGSWVSADPPDAGGGSMFGPSTPGTIPEALPAGFKDYPRLTVIQDGTLAESSCIGQDPPWRGQIDGSVATGPNGERLQLAGGGKLLVGRADNRSIVLMRTAQPVAECAETTNGHGPEVLVLIRDGTQVKYESDPAYFPKYRFHRVMAMMLDAARLSRASFVVLDEVCDGPHDLSIAQQKMLLDWVAAGHKLIVRDSDPCRTSDYSFLPYPFKTSGSPASGAKSKILVIADPSALGAGPSDPAHFLDTKAYVASTQPDLGDADVMVTQDSHWCGHVLGASVLGQVGWGHAYARYGRGLIIYDGFDRDDLAGHLAPAIALVRYEYDLPVQTELPCNAKVASKLVLYPPVDRKLAAGTPATLRADLVLVNGDQPESTRTVELSISGDVAYRATVSPSNIAAPGGKPIPIVATIAVPKGWSGVHAFTVTGDGGGSDRAQTTIRIDGSVPLAHAFMQQRRVRVYGIHFDVDSAHIQPQSEATVAQIAAVLKANPSWHMRVEGYTDSDGGAAYNQSLSERRAQSVVNDLVTRYSIARSRLVAAGYGLTHPVASNDTEAGKALNRRVELVRL